MRPKPNQSFSEDHRVTLQIDVPENTAEEKSRNGSINSESRSVRTAPFPIACIGMSAGGIVPLVTLFRMVSPQTGMAFVVIHHLRQDHPTHLPEILSRCTSMPVQLAKAGSSIKPNHVYILPSGQELLLSEGDFTLCPRRKLLGWTNVLSLFLESLTTSKYGKLAVILSGMDADGAAALKAFKQHGGITIVQAPDTASSREMPEAAIKTGAVDYILEPEAMAHQLERIAEKLKFESAPRIYTAVSS